ncbi:MAG: PilZ domain-containing protein [Proteobacteria bacterium]|nr:PilZ domain-containing protein [Pseudomonadota bacterium]
MSAASDPGRILYLGPSAENSAKILGQLRAFGFEVLAVSSSHSAREALSGSATVDFVVADMDAGENEVRDIVFHMKNTPAMEEIPIIALLNAESVDAVTELFDLGCDEFLRKPADSALLKDKLSVLLWSPRRATPRVGCRFSARIISGRTADPGEIVQISEGGAALLLPKRRPEERVLTVRFALPEEGEEEISLAAAVIHVREEEGQFLHGVRFVTPGSETLRKIRRFVQKTLL